MTRGRQDLPGEGSGRRQGFEEPRIEPPPCAHAPPDEPAKPVPPPDLDDALNQRAEPRPVASRGAGWMIDGQTRNLRRNERSSGASMARFYRESRARSINWAGACRSRAPLPAGSARPDRNHWTCHLPAHSVRPFRRLGFRNAGRGRGGMVDAGVSNTPAARRVGSTPTARTRTIGAIATKGMPVRRHGEARRSRSGMEPAQPASRMLAVT